MPRTRNYCLNIALRKEYILGVDSIPWMETVVSGDVFLESKKFCVLWNAVDRMRTQKVFALLFIVKESYPQEINSFVIYSFIF